MSIQQGDGMDDEIVAINVTPLVDVVLVLLIIFMVTASFIIKETVEVDLPKAANTGETVQGLISIVIDKEGNFFLDGTQVDEPALKQHIRNSVLKDKESRAIVSADQALAYGRVMHVIDIVKGEGIAKFALNIQKEASAASE
ncbi:MAG: biopolymer transporter ExbD [Cystobacterineae bacterium]|nr:biopolymer transporter ExbD [Cystobacterineae bacterium]